MTMKFGRHILLFLVGAVLTLSFQSCRPEQAEYSHTLNDLHTSLQEKYLDQSRMQQKFLEEYGRAHDQMVLAIDKSENLPVLLYTQAPDYTLNLCRILKELTREHDRFIDKQRDYEHIFQDLDTEIGRYERLIASLKQRPVEPAMETCRDSCISYASGILDSYTCIRETLSEDKLLYQDAVRRMNVTNDYVQTCFAQLKDFVFKEGQTSWPQIFSHPQYYMDRLRHTVRTADEEQARLNLLSGAFRRSTLPMILNFLALLAAILLTLWVRAKGAGLKTSLRLFLPAIFAALMVTICRIGFMPDRLITLILAPLLLGVCIWQLIVCIRCSGKTEQLDRIVGWASLIVELAALVTAFFGFAFIAMIVVIWWFVQLAVIFAMQCCVYLTRQYKEKKVDPRIEAYDDKVADITGLNRRAFLFGTTWLYNLIVGVLLPVAGILSVPFCIKLALEAFDFSAVFEQLYTAPFLHLRDNDGGDVLKMSAQSIVLLVCLFFVFRYVVRLIHGLWQNLSFASVRRKTHREKINSNDINLSLGNTIITVLLWLVYIAIVIVTLRIPIGTLGLVAGGFSAGLGLALKEPINNFISGIQLMSGRIRVGDFIECDGVRGKVISIGYLNTVLRVVDDDSYIVFLNSTLFNKNFKNLSRNSIYDYLKVTVNVCYGTDVEKVRTLLLDAAESLKTKDGYGRDLVEPGFGIQVVVDSFNEKDVDFGMAQYVLIEEHIAYTYHARELIYKTLSQNGITPTLRTDVQILK